jgi:hypothetical protein
MDSSKGSSMASSTGSSAGSSVGSSVDSSVGSSGGSNVGSSMGSNEGSYIMIDMKVPLVRKLKQEMLNRIDNTTNATYWLLVKFHDNPLLMNICTSIMNTKTEEIK